MQAFLRTLLTTSSLRSFIFEKSKDTSPTVIPNSSANFTLFKRRASEINAFEGMHPRVEAVLSDGCSVPVPAATVTVAYSFQVMEHIHADDALEQLRNLFAALAPGGSYFCVTPNRLNGPHDVSKFFDLEARGFHLKEYTITELDALFREVGFRKVEARVRFGRSHLRLPLGLLKGFERILSALPVAWRRRVGRWPLIRNLLSAPLRALK